MAVQRERFIAFCVYTGKSEGSQMKNHDTKSEVIRETITKQYQKQ